MAINLTPAKLAVLDAALVDHLTVLVVRLQIERPGVTMESVREKVEAATQLREELRDARDAGEPNA